MAKKSNSECLPTDAKKQAQGDRCGCHGQDDMCDCQNAVLQDSRRAQPPLPRSRQGEGVSQRRRRGCGSGRPETPG